MAVPVSFESLNLTLPILRVEKRVRSTHDPLDGVSIVGDSEFWAITKDPLGVHYEVRIPELMYLHLHDIWQRANRQAHHVNLDAKLGQQVLPSPRE
jgi:hypothetical protein